MSTDGQHGSNSELSVSLDRAPPATENGQPQGDPLEPAKEPNKEQQPRDCGRIAQAARLNKDDVEDQNTTSTAKQDDDEDGYYSWVEDAAGCKVRRFSHQHFERRLARELENDEIEAHASESFPFLKLPPEIRNKIYRIAVRSDDNFIKVMHPRHKCTAVTYPCGKCKGKLLPGITAVSRQVRRECLGFYYSVNYFILPLTAEDCLAWLNKVVTGEHAKYFPALAYDPRDTMPQDYLWEIRDMLLMEINLGKPFVGPLMRLALLSLFMPARDAVQFMKEDLIKTVGLPYDTKSVQLSTYLFKYIGV